ncbi:MAG TPA: hypothetical protein DC013_11340 [Ruminococcaceae bacterium]|nr:hypothetical protein [Oscillospiraceae bacterium]
MNNTNPAYSAVYNNPYFVGGCPSCGSPAAGGWNPQKPAAPSAAPQSAPGQPAASQPAAQQAPFSAAFPSPQGGMVVVPQSGAAQQGAAAQQQGTAIIPSAPAAPPAAGTAGGDLSPITDLTQPMPMTAESLQYLNGFMRTQIGRRVLVQFLLGTNTLTDRSGTLLGVGSNYILINETDSDDLLACDFYNIKFVRFYY